MLTVVLTHYRLPSHRLHDFIAWNAAVFRRYHVRVIVVSDVPHAWLPPYARSIVYPHPMATFSLARTSNYGIRRAGDGIICKTDPDCVFSAEIIDALMRVDQCNGVAPRYCMAPSYSERHEAWRYHCLRSRRERRRHPLGSHYRNRDSVWPATCGTLALHSDTWARICGYDERMEGYGIEDGIAMRRALSVGRCTVGRPDVPFWHIDHTGASDGYGNRRTDCWGRETGFNPPSHAQNKMVLKKLSPWHSVAHETWGAP